MWVAKENGKRGWRKEVVGRSVRKIEDIEELAVASWHVSMHVMGGKFHGEKRVEESRSKKVVKQVT